MPLTIPSSPAYVLTNGGLPTDLAAGLPLRPGPDRIATVDVLVAQGRIGAITPAGHLAGREEPKADLAGGLVLPRFVDCHTHLDKGHIWARSPNPDGTFLGARTSVRADRETHWRREDVELRMDFALRSAFAHGTAAIRTHIDSIGPQTAISWPLFADVRAAWKDRIALQAVALFPVETAIDDEPQFRDIVTTVARNGGILGGLTYLGEPLTGKLDRALDRLFEAAAAHGLDIDLHVDESASADARSLERVADAAIRHRFKGRIVAGHCCALALMAKDELDRVIAKIGEAGIAVVSLPMCNMYLQDREPGRTPRWRGVAPLTELAAAGIEVMIASDNTRDPFYAYGDLDMLEVFREATRILHLDHSAHAWARLLGPAPADIMGVAGAGGIRVGGPADLVALSARSLNELNARPQSDRVVVVAGRPIERGLPDYRELDRLLPA